MWLLAFGVPVNVSSLSLKGGHKVLQRPIAARLPQKRHGFQTRATAATNRSLGVVVTGGSRGIGFALAAGFLRAGDRVVVCSRGSDTAEVTAALSKLRTLGSGAVFHTCCDVSVPEDVERLGNFVAESLDQNIDCWINNAGQVGTRGNLIDLPADEVVGVVNTNLLGVLLCSRVAHRIMKERGGHVFTMDGAGSGGNATASYVAYGATKRAVPQMVSSLSKELKDSTVRFHTLSPGMVLTDLLLSGNENDTKSLQFFNYLAEEPDTVAEDLVPRIRSVVLDNRKTNQYIKFLTLPRAFLQIAAGFLFGFRRNRYFNADGERVDKSTGQFKDNGVRKLT